MGRLKFEMKKDETEERSVYTYFTDGNGIVTESWWSSPPSSIDHVGPEYLRQRHRHPNVSNKRHDEFIKRRFKEEIVKLKGKEQ